MFKAIQYTETLANEIEANAVMQFLANQEGFLGGRILAARPEKPGWKVQAFFKDEETSPCFDGWLPDGCRSVVIPPSLAHVLGINPSIIQSVSLTSVSVTL